MGRIWVFCSDDGTWIGNRDGTGVSKTARMRADCQESERLPVKGIPTGLERDPFPTTDGWHEHVPAIFVARTGNFIHCAASVRCFHGVFSSIFQHCDSALLPRSVRIPYLTNSNASTRCRAPSGDATSRHGSVSMVPEHLFAMFVTRPTRHPLSTAGRLLFPVGFPRFSSPRRGPPCDGPRKHSETKPIPTPAHALPLLSPIPLHVVGTAWSRNTSLRSPPY